MSAYKWLACLVLLLIASRASFADTIDFESFADNELLTTYLGLTFTNAVVHRAGFSLPHEEFPPNAGSENAAADFICDFSDPNNAQCGLGTGPIIINFPFLIQDFSGYFNYANGLTLEAFKNGVSIGAATSMFTENFVSSGNPTNELIALSFAGGFNRVVLTGSPSGNSFTVDDITYTQQTTVVSEPASLILLALGLGVLPAIEFRRPSRAKEPSGSANVDHVRWRC